jgi:uncharacterized LabA/DUF88 family protein
MDMIRQAQKCDAIVLMSGDGDYIPVVNYVQQTFGCTVEVMSFGRSSSKALLEEADEFVDIEKNVDTFLFKKRKYLGSTRTPVTPASPVSSPQVK